MRDQESCGRPERPNAKAVLVELQKLVDTRPTDGKYPLEWAVPAHFLGDMTALAVLSLRCRT